MNFSVRTVVSRLRLRVGVKFAISVGVLLLAVLAVAGVGGVGLTRMDAQTNQLFDDDLALALRLADLKAGLDDVEKSVLQLVPMVESGPTSRLEAELDQVLIPRVRQEIAAVRTLSAEYARPALPRLDQIEARFNEFLRLRGSGAYSTTGEAANSAAANAALAARTSTLFDRITGQVDALRAAEYEEAATAQRRAHDSYRSTWGMLLGGVALALVFGLAVVLLLVRNLVPRIQAYSRFARGIASGHPSGTLEPRGSDELAELGRALNDMVAKNELLGTSEEAQSEFVDTLQVTATEEEAHELVQRHIERCLPDTTAVVLKRNNSDNRLQAATALAPGSELVDRLVGAEPRGCLALRFSRTHREGTERPPLLSCGLCGDRDTRSTCEPLLVGGEVIGSVLVTHRQRLDEDEAGRIKSSVAQAAPVLANLRNLALAEFRANSDALTGLPNKRATEDTLKRMVAQANRSITPLTAAVLDLDHFKQINDRYGHGRGDEVLAAVGVALRSSLRASDFVGRYGGEEFLILLPETTTDAGVQVAEKIRNAIAALTIPGVEHDITASIGVADLLEHAGDATGLVREADRAMYAAKTAGRNCTLVAASDSIKS
jgi:diguanylate cyclase (GGDEF)-like protein